MTLSSFIDDDLDADLRRTLRARDAMPRWHQLGKFGSNSV